MTIRMTLKARAKRLAAMVGAAAVISGGGLTLCATASPTVAAAATACGSTPAKVHYELALTSNAPMISAIALSGLATGCNGATAKLTLRGNSTGSSATSSKTPVLSTADSTVTPCSGGKLTTPTKVKTGSITFRLCRTSTAASPGPYVSVHDLTNLTLTIGGASVSPGSVVFTTGPTGHNGGSGATAGALAFTGADIAAMVAAGLILLALGMLLVLWERRRHRLTGSEAWAATDGGQITREGT